MVNDNLYTDDGDFGFYDEPVEGSDGKEMDGKGEGVAVDSKDGENAKSDSAESGIKNNVKVGIATSGLEGTDSESEDSGEANEGDNVDSKDPDADSEELGVNFSSLNLNGLDLEMDTSDESEEEGSVFSPEERLRMFGDMLMSCCCKNNETAAYALDKLTTSTNPRLFRDENYVLFTVFFNYRSKIKRINIDAEFIRLFLNRNRKFISQSRRYIDINAYGEVDGSVELGYIGGVVKHYNRLIGMEDMSIAEFDTCLEKYLIEFKAIESAKVYSKAQTMLLEGMTIGNKRYFGFEDSYNWCRRELAVIEGLVNLDSGTGFITMNEVLKEEKQVTKKPIKVADFDRLEALNKVYGGIYTGNFYQVLAPPKCGKTKLCVRICHTAVVKYGTNVTVWAQEGGYNLWTAQMRAIHFDYTYNTGKDITERKTGLDGEMISRDEFPSQEYRDLEMSSKMDLETNPTYGTVDYIDRKFEVETFLDDIKTSVQSNNSKIVIVDYLQLIGSATNKTERERVAEAYKKALVFCSDMNIALISPGQVKQETINELLSMGDTSNADARTSGGSSAEVIRTPDIIIALWASTQDLLNNTMKILSMPSRKAKAFPEINVVHDLGVCQFISVEK